MGKSVQPPNGKYIHTNVLVEPSGLKSYERPIKKGFRGNISQIKKLLTTGRSICVAGAGKWETLEIRLQDPERGQNGEREERGLGREPQGSPELGRSTAGFKGEVGASGAY